VRASCPSERLRFPARGGSAVVVVAGFGLRWAKMYLVGCIER
jgi:hypothetical protein